MSELLADLWRFPFLQFAVLAGLLASIACGAVGCLVVARRSTYIAGAIAHSVLGGMGLARWLDRVHGLHWFTPLLGATLAALLVAVIIAVVGRSLRSRLDTVLSAIWAIGMAVGITFIHLTPGYHEDLMSYLFGNILMVGAGDLWLMLILDLVIVGLIVGCYDRFLAIGFQGELARLRGVRVWLWELLLLVLIALTVVLLTQVVGLVLVIALLSLPAATALRATARLWVAMLLASACSLACILGGIALSYGPGLPTGATIILCAGGLYLTVIIGTALRRRLRRPAHEN